MARMPRSIGFARRAGSSRSGALHSVRRGRVWVPRAALWAAGTVVLAGAVLVQMGDSGVPSWRRLRAQDAEAGRQVQELQEQNLALRRELQALREDPETLERLAREKAGMQRPDEVVVRVRPAVAEGSR